jgi:hypothetical protein
MMEPYLPRQVYYRPNGTATHARIQQFITALAQIFSKYCTPRPSPQTSSTRLSALVETAYLDEAGLDAWAKDTNGTEFPQETKEEMKDTLDVTEKGDLTYVLVFE